MLVEASRLSSQGNQRGGLWPSLASVGSPPLPAQLTVVALLLEPASLRQLTPSLTWVSAPSSADLGIVFWCSLHTKCWKSASGDLLLKTGFLQHSNLLSWETVLSVLSGSFNGWLCTVSHSPWSSLQYPCPTVQVRPLHSTLFYTR